jgi:hypothetical protein
MLICEDKAQERLFRPLLERKFGRGRVRVEPRRPAGGWEFVKNNVAKLAATPSLRRREAVGLLVVFDGDTKAQARRTEVRQLAGFLGVGNGWTERVAVCIPTRNVETWLLWLTGEDEVDEEQDFKRDVQNRPDYDGLPRRAADAWFAVSPDRRRAEQLRLPALMDARRELDRILAIADSR